MGNASGFGIGTYQPLSGVTTTIGSGFPNAPFQLVHPYAGTYGGNYGYVIDTTIKSPNEVQWTPAPEIGIDGIGNSVIRGFPQIEWDYPIMRPDHWYKLKFLRNQSAKVPPAYQYIVLLQYPDVFGSGVLAQQLARFEPITFSSRTSAIFQSVVLKFTYVGQAQLLSGTPISIIA
jgi:hypothetical protein